MIFKRVGEGRPYPDHGRRGARDWADVPPRQVRLEDLVTTKRTLDLDHLLAEDSTFFGDLFPHIVSWRGEMYLEDGLHRAVRAALSQRNVLHARVLTLDETVVAAEPAQVAEPVAVLALPAEVAAATGRADTPAPAGDVPSAVS